MPGHYSDVMGGAQYQVKCLIEYFAKLNKAHEIYYVTRNFDEHYSPSNYRIVKIPLPTGGKNTSLIRDFPSILKLLNDIKPDVIYQRVASSYTGAAAYYAKRNNCQSIWHISSDADVSKQNFKLRKNAISRYLDYKLLQYGIRNVDKIIAQTRTQANLLKKNYHREVDAVIPNFHPLPKENIDKNYPVTILWIANIKKLKQPEIFINLARDLQHISTARFIMIGSMQDSSEWAQQIRETIHQIKNLECIGETPQDEVNSILAKSHILVNTSQYEGFSNTFIQAWMRKVPVVSLNVNPDNLFDNYELGFFSGTYQNLLKNVEALINDVDKRDSIGISARKYALKFHSLKNAAVLVDMLESDG